MLQLHRLARAFLVGSALWLGACAPLLADYSLDAYRNATSLKAEVGALVDEADEPFKEHEAEVRAISVKIDAAYEFAAGIPNNELAMAQWNELRGPDLFGEFVSQWREKEQLSETYRNETGAILDDAFDAIACLEVNKKERKRCVNTEGEGG